MYIHEFELALKFLELKVQIIVLWLRIALYEISTPINFSFETWQWGRVSVKIDIMVCNIKNKLTSVGGEGIRMPISSMLVSVDQTIVKNKYIYNWPWEKKISGIKNKDYRWSSITLILYRDGEKIKFLRHSSIWKGKYMPRKNIAWRGYEYGGGRKKINC